MNVQSIIVLAIILAAFVWTLRYVVRGNKRHPGCSGCSGCSSGKCSELRRCNDGKRRDCPKP